MAVVDIVTLQVFPKLWRWSAKTYKRLGQQARVWREERRVARDRATQLRQEQQEAQHRVDELLSRGEYFGKGFVPPYAKTHQIYIGEKHHDGVRSTSPKALEFIQSEIVGLELVTGNGRPAEIVGVYKRESGSIQRVTLGSPEPDVRHAIEVFPNVANLIARVRYVCFVPSYREALIRFDIVGPKSQKTQFHWTLA